MASKLAAAEGLALSGLSEAEAQARLREAGFNELPAAESRGILRIAGEVLREPMLLLLLGCCGIYFLLGDARDALVLTALVGVVIGITLYQERKTERALESLRDLSSPRALVIRDGVRKRIAGREVAPGDILVLAEGDRVPADGVVLAATNLAIDESLLTGESLAVDKNTARVDGTAPGEHEARVYSGTLVVRGSGIARAEATGPRTELGKIGRSLQTVESEPTPLQREAGRIVRVIALAAILLCALLLVLYGLTRGDWLRGFLAALTMAMSVLPEELPVVLTIFLALGAWRISRVQVLTRRMPAIEALGAATVLCVDKTGTLTMNQMTVDKLNAGGGVFDAAGAERVPRKFQELVEYAALATRPEAFDPMDQAIRGFARKVLQDGRPHDGWQLEREYPAGPGCMAVCDVWRSPEVPQLTLAAKGAPEAMADLCGLDTEAARRLQEEVSAMAVQGLRVLGVGAGSVAAPSLPDGIRGLALRFVGLIALADPVRPGVPEAVRECRAAGIRVVMITGDFPGTARSVATRIGFPPQPVLLTGPELNQLDDDRLRQCIGEVAIFARTVPEQKLRIVNALRANGEVVAMTGDGVNDAPALKAAHIGIAMGERGTDVAREAAALVLLDDHFSSIVHAVRMGRRIFDNLRKAVAYTFAIHVPIAGLSIVPVFLGWPLIFSPVHIAFLELIIDPACSVVFEMEAEEAGIMERPPRPMGARLFEWRGLRASLLQGAGALVVTLAIFAVAWYRGQGEADARTLTFTTLVIANLCLIHANRSGSRGQRSHGRNTAQWWISAGALVFLAAVLYIPALRDMFAFSTLHPLDLALCGIAGLATLAWFGALRMRRPRTLGQESPR